MRSALSIAFATMAMALTLHAQQPPKAPAEPKALPPRFIEPGETRRDIASQKPRGELVRYDPATRTGTFKKSSDGTLAHFIALPHVVCQHHGALGEMSDYKIGERLRFIVHENKDGQWNLLGLVSEELEECVAHDEPYFLDKIDAEKGILTCTRRNRDGSKIVWPGMTIHTDKETRYWRDGKPTAAMADLKVGMPLFIKTHGGSEFLDRIAWEVLLDKASVEHFKSEQAEAHRKRMITEGMPGYLDAVASREVRVTLFPEAMGYILGGTGPVKAPAGQRPLKKGGTVELSIAGPARAAKGKRFTAKVTELRPYIRQSNYICEVKLTLTEDPPAEFKPTANVRVWGETSTAAKKP